MEIDNSILNSEPKKTIHMVKCLSIFYQDVIDGTKCFEVRKNDRNYKVGDAIVLHEVRENKVRKSWREAANDVPDLISTGRCKPFMITYLLQGERWGIKEGYCVLGLGKI